MTTDRTSVAVPEGPRETRARRWPGRIGWTLFVLFLVVILGAVLFFRFSVRRAFPDVEGTVTVPGLGADVEVIRDSMGIPHIYADTVEDLYLAQGYVHAQDRFFQMDFWRHISYGRLSEMFGSAQVDTDTFLRTMDWGGLAERQYEAETDEIRTIIDAYAAGVNAYLDTRSPAELGFEYTVIDVLARDYEPEPWTPPQSLAWGKAMAWELGGNLDKEIERAILASEVGADRVAQLFPPYPYDRHPVIVPSVGGGVEASLVAPEGMPDGVEPALRAAHEAVSAVDRLLAVGRDGAVGSNSWVIAGAHTPSGAPLLMNDPHLGSQMPSIWYQVGLHCRSVSPECPFDVAGFSFAGVPGVVIGHNAEIAWGFTNVGPDVQDLYIEKVNPDDDLQYEVDGEWIDMDTRTETIEVAGGDPVEVTVRSTIHGPIISDAYGLLDEFDTDGELPEPYALALRWTGLDDGPSIAGPIAAFNTATDWEEFRAAADSFTVPAQNLVYADRAGNIGYQMPGAIPIRTAGDGTYPVPGWTGEYEWEGFVPFEDLPSSYNPPSGWIVTANNAVVDSSWNGLITEDWSYGFRARRIVDLVTSRLGSGMADQALIQLDGKDLNAEELLPIALSVLQPTPDTVAADAAGAMAAWDLQNDIDSAGAAVWNALWRHLLARTFHDEVPEDFWPEGGDRWFEAMRGLVSVPDDPWWDDTTTEQREGRDEIMRMAFADAVDELRAELGDDVASWRWGDLHTITFRNQSLGDSGVGLIEDRFNRGPYPVAGSKSVPNAVGWDADVGYEVDWVPSMRMLVDLSDLSASRTIHTTGQSGHTDHPHYDDMIPLWIAGETVPMLWEREDIEADAEATLVLTP